VILPTKHIPTHRSLLGLGGIVLTKLTGPTTPSALWEEIRPYPEIATYSRFILTLDLLFAMGAIELREGLIARAEAA
jgi:hypothetical protein